MCRSSGALSCVHESLHLEISSARVHTVVHFVYTDVPHAYL